VKSDSPFVKMPPVTRSAAAAAAAAAASTAFDETKAGKKLPDFLFYFYY